MLGRDEQMQPEFVDFQNFAGVLVLLEERLFLGQGFQKIHQVGFRQGCDTGVT